jgi:hypothetical protein
MVKTKIIFLAVMALSLTWLSAYTTNTAQAQQFVPDRYASECGIYLLMPPEQYLQVVAKEWNYNLSSMPKTLADQYTCVNAVHIQEKADDVLSQLSHAITRGDNN